MTEHAREALEHLRDPGQFQWYVVPLLLVVIYVYASEIQRRDWNVLFAGLAFWGMDWFNETWNALVFHVTGRAPVWGVTGPTAYQILIGLNIEICFMFAIMGVAAAKMLPRDPSVRVIGIPNRWLLAGVNAALCVGVELLLHRAGALTWDWSWWQASCPYLIWLIGYLPFFLVCFWVHDMKRVRTKALTVGVILGVDAAALALFGALGYL
ncbi:hypothetical protein ACIGXM_15355 [Kitasatospora sp. NPDC052896]|uniref:hypothetical protein n=1 Tax=Kitasatospora sp. NPDC052896 TaxID=3364061 RepID=UPI0037CA6F66